VCNRHLNIELVLNAFALLRLHTELAYLGLFAAATVGHFDDLDLLFFAKGRDDRNWATANCLKHSGMRRAGHSPVASATAKPTIPIQYAAVALPFGAEVVENQRPLLRLDDLADELDPAVGVIRGLEVDVCEASDGDAFNGFVDAVADGERSTDVVG